MAVDALAALEPKTHLTLGGLHIVYGAATAPRSNPHTIWVARQVGPKILADLRHIARADLADIDDVTQLKPLLKNYRELVKLLESILEIQRKQPHKWIQDLLGTPKQIDSVLECLEDKVEDLEIATDPEVKKAIEQIIVEAKAP